MRGSASLRRDSPRRVQSGHRPRGRTAITIRVVRRHHVASICALLPNVNAAMGAWRGDSSESQSGAGLVPAFTSVRSSNHLRHNHYAHINQTTHFRARRPSDRRVRVPGSGGAHDLGRAREKDRARSFRQCRTKLGTCAHCARAGVARLQQSTWESRAPAACL